MPGDFSPKQEDGSDQASVQGQSTQKHELTPNGVTPAQDTAVEGFDVDIIEQAISDVLNEGGSIRDAARYVSRCVEAGRWAALTAADRLADATAARMADLDGYDGRFGLRKALKNYRAIRACWSQERDQ